jgi:hypothetical protein
MTRAAIDVYGLAVVSAPLDTGLPARLAGFAAIRPPDVVVDVRDAGPRRPGRPSGLIADARRVRVADPFGRTASLDPATWMDDVTTIECDAGIDDETMFGRVVVRALRARMLLHTGTAVVRASAFELDGARIAVVGRPGAGKTRLLIDALARGAALIGDDWIVVGADGTCYPLDRHIDLVDDAIRSASFALDGAGRAGRVGRALAGIAGRARATWPSAGAAASGSCRRTGSRKA